MTPCYRRFHSAERPQGASALRAPWLALTPKQYSTGGKTRLGRISKHGDRYLRTLLVHGAHSMLLLNWKKSDRKRCWAEALKTRKPWNRVAVALTDKHARILWVMLARGKTYRPSRVPPAPSEAPA
jgi:transposase